MAAAFGTLDSVVETNCRRARGGVLAGEIDYILSGNSGQLRGAIGSPFGDAGFQFVEAESVAFDVVAVFGVPSLTMTCIMARASAAATVPGLIA